MTRDQQRLVDYPAHIALPEQLLGAGRSDPNFQIIGEASNNIDRRYPDFAAAHPELPLSFAYQMRNALAHGYFKVDFEVVWKTIHQDLPGLYARIQAAQASVRGIAGPTSTH